MKICIDPGHYGRYNRCPAIPEYYESEMVWKLSQLQKQYLEQMGHEVIMTRTDSKKDLSLDKRGKASKGCDLFISNHSNAVGNGMSEDTRYVAVYHLVDDKTTNCDDVSKDFAHKIAPVIANVMGVTFKVLTRKSANDRNKDGVLNDNYYGVLNGARSVNTPGLILEHSFHTSSASVRWLLQDANLDRLARAEAECINEFFRGAAAPVKPVNPAATATYTVVKGDTLIGIGKKTGVPWKTIADLNGIKYPYVIRVGQKLKIK